MKIFWFLFLLSACTTPVSAPDFEQQNLAGTSEIVPLEIDTTYTPAVLIRVGPSQFELYQFPTLGAYRTWRADRTGLIDIVWVHMNPTPRPVP